MSNVLTYNRNGGEQIRKVSRYRSYKKESKGTGRIKNMIP